MQSMSQVPFSMPSRAQHSPEERSMAQRAAEQRDAHSSA